jgi:hypothetical protein
MGICKDSTENGPTCSVRRPRTLLPAVAPAAPPLLEASWNCWISRKNVQGPPAGASAAACAARSREGLASPPRAKRAVDARAAGGPALQATAFHLDPRIPRREPGCRRGLLHPAPGPCLVPGPLRPEGPPCSPPCPTGGLARRPRLGAPPSPRSPDVGPRACKPPGAGCRGSRGPHAGGHPLRRDLGGARALHPHPTHLGLRRGFQWLSVAS